MNWKETYTKIFLKNADISINPNTLKEYLPMWWKNSRSKDVGGLRLTDKGLDFITKKLDLKTYEVPFPVDFSVTTQTIIFLDRFINCPYFLADDGIIVTNEKKAMELMLFSGDIRKYGISKAMTRQEFNNEE
jgi:hypothetical protein|tara:strand:- start:1877 stop:2272 length:396 start_codon:yes stop_codon:yes gene_type:complete